jgi:methyltransferase (TIGR00027 family)
MIDVETVGKTAFVVAYMRLLETARLSPLAFDPIAHALLGAEGIALAEPVCRSSPMTVDLVATRTRYFDDRLSEAVRSGCRQVVLLGAGLDARSMRIGGAKYFEVDRADVLGWKARRLASTGFTWPSTQVACDYTRVDVAGELGAVGLRLDEPSFVLWEGNSMYIPLDEIERLLGSLRASLPRATIAFDFLPQAIAVGGTPLTRAFAGLGAPWVTGIDDLEGLARRTGYGIGHRAVFAELLGQLRPHRALDGELAGTYSGCVFEPALGGRA